MATAKISAAGIEIELEDEDESANGLRGQALWVFNEVLGKLSIEDVDG